jgi:hypothetical protein
VGKTGLFLLPYNVAGISYRHTEAALLHHITNLQRTDKAVVYNLSRTHKIQNALQFLSQEQLTFPSTCSERSPPSSPPAPNMRPTCAISNV